MSNVITFVVVVGVVLLSVGKMMRMRIDDD